MIFEIVLGNVILLVALYYFITRDYNYWKVRGVPYDKPFFIFGSLYDVVAGKMHMFEKIRELYNKHNKEPYIGIFTFNRPSLLVRNPELVKKILVKDFDKFFNRISAVNERDPIGYHNIAFAKDSTWRNLRTKLSPTFSSGKLKLMLPLINDCVKDLTKHLNERAEQTLDLKEVTKKYAVDIISSCAFGINSNCLTADDSEIMKMATQILDPKSLVRNLSLMCYQLAPVFVKIFNLTVTDRTASDYFLNIFNLTLKKRQNENIVRNDFIDLLQNLKKNETFKDDYKFDNIKMGAQAIVFFTAGNDSTSTTLSFVYYQLALNQDVQDRLRKEITDTFEKDGSFTYESVQTMKYLDMVFKETLRMYPLVAFLSREAKTDYVIEETGFTIKKDLNVLIPLPGLHHDPKYFPNPEKFDPERFSDENKHNIVPCTYLPFGEGPRICIGERFATLVSKMALAHTVKDFAFETTISTSIPLQLDPRTQFLSNRTGIQLKVRKVNP